MFLFIFQYIRKMSPKKYYQPQALVNQSKNMLAQWSKQPLFHRESKHYENLILPSSSNALPPPPPPPSTAAVYHPYSAYNNSKFLARRRRRPPHSYAALIAQAIMFSRSEMLTLRQIYEWIQTRYPTLYQANEIGWQVIPL